ncbi:hypothetical protein Tco_1391314 [Tanacetum coccineum]
MASALRQHLAGLTLVDRPILGLDYDLHPLNVNADLLEMEKYVKDYKIIFVYVVMEVLGKKIEKYIRGFPERIKGNITSSKPATLHDAIIMARELVEQAVQGRAARIGESNKQRWEDH